MDIRFLKVLSVVACFWAFGASAFSLSSSGVWSSAEQGDGSVPNLAGVGTNEITWGSPTGTNASGYLFEGFTEDVMVDGSLFAIGDFTHHNFAVPLPSITGATLEVNLEVAGVAMDGFSFFFGHEETPNSGICAPAGTTVCPDVVSIPSATSGQPVEIDGVNYILSIVGFSQDGGLNIVDQFITEENQANTATLFARLERLVTLQIVPEPSTLALLSFGFLVLVGMAKGKLGPMYRTTPIY